MKYYVVQLAVKSEYVDMVRAVMHKHTSVVHRNDNGHYVDLVARFRYALNAILLQEELIERFEPY